MFDVSADELIERISEKLKKIDAIDPPQWAQFAKTAVNKERPPVNLDWWYVRAASVLRKVGMLGPIGVSKLRTKYGGKRNLGVRPGHFCKGSGNILRKIFQQLETAELLQKSKSSKAGRVLSAKGMSLLDKSATEISREKPKAKKPEVKKEEKKPVEAKKEEPVKKDKPVEAKKEESKKTEEKK